jgi:phenylpropionate dioxygenase-like ring-hydroxylating dioxygenase large terminal subunit
MKLDLKAIAATIESGRVDPVIFHDDELYRLELDRIFNRSWLFLGHESMLKNPGDYFTTYMGEESVIVIVDERHKVGAFLNRCRHRGAQLCPFDRGNAKALTCPYHGWSYGTDGRLRNVPEFESYCGTLNKSEWGLLEVGKVASYGGFIFANMDAGAISLDDFLGDLRYYMDNMVGRTHAGGLEMSAIKQRVLSQHNWKVAADNGSDMYHVPVTHGGAMGTLQDFPQFMPMEGMGDSIFVSTCSHAGANHSVTGGLMCPDAEGYDMARAQLLGPDAVDYIQHRYQLERRQDPRLRLGHLSITSVFPTALFVDVGVVSVGIALELWHPKGPEQTETWIYVLVEKEAPAALKKFAAQQSMRFHSVSGSVVQDDHENWERIRAGTRGAKSQQYPLNYYLGPEQLRGPDKFYSQKYHELPGSTTYAMSDVGARGMYREWARLIQEQ